MTDLCIHCRADIKTCGCPDECEMSDCHNDISSPNARFQCGCCHTHYCGECRRIYRTVANGVAYESEYCADPDCNEWIDRRRVA